MTAENKPLMPKATAVWLVENTSLTFDQIAEFCDLHMLEIRGIADGDVAQGIRGKDPITGGELTRDEIRKGEADPKYRLKLRRSKVELPQIKTKKAPRYTPVSRRQDRPNAILWLVKHHPELADAQIVKLVGTTKPTILQIKERSHWNAANLVPQDPVTLGLCSQVELDNAVQKAAARVEKERREMGDAFTPAGATLSATAETTGYVPPGMGEQPSLDDLPPPTANREADASQEDARMLEQLNRMSAPAEAASQEPAPSVEDVFAKPGQEQPEIADNEGEREKGGDGAGGDDASPASATAPADDEETGDDGQPSAEPDDETREQ